MRKEPTSARKDGNTKSARACTKHRYADPKRLQGDRERRSEGEEVHSNGAGQQRTRKYAHKMRDREGLE